MVGTGIIQGSHGDIEPFGVTRTSDNYGETKLNGINVLAVKHINILLCGRWNSFKTAKITGVLKM